MIKSIYWLLFMVVISTMTVLSCNSPANKQAKEEPVEPIEELAPDTVTYSEDTTLTDDEGVMDDTIEEEENE